VAFLAPQSTDQLKRPCVHSAVPLPRYWRRGGFTPSQKESFVEGAKTRIPLGRTGTVGEVAAAALYLAADVTYTTGAELFVDGGLIDL
jgi:NAD(P)-dependent dehydrogenase (short-subunit alcohol dehydrogenase family)